MGVLSSIFPFANRSKGLFSSDWSIRGNTDIYRIDDIKPNEDIALEKVALNSFKPSVNNCSLVRDIVLSLREKDEKILGYSDFLTIWKNRNKLDPLMWKRQCYGFKQTIILFPRETLISPENKSRILAMSYYHRQEEWRYYVIEFYGRWLEDQYRIALFED